MCDFNEALASEVVRIKALEYMLDESNAGYELNYYNIEKLFRSCDLTMDLPVELCVVQNADDTNKELNRFRNMFRGMELYNGRND